MKSLSRLLEFRNWRGHEMFRYIRHNGRHTHIQQIPWYRSITFCL